MYRGYLFSLGHELGWATPNHNLSCLNIKVFIMEIPMTNRWLMHWSYRSPSLVLNHGNHSKYLFLSPWKAHYLLSHTSIIKHSEACAKWPASADDILKCIFVNQNFVLIQISLSLFVIVQETICHHWFRQWLGAYWIWTAVNCSIFPNGTAWGCAVIS